MAVDEEMPLDPLAGALAQGLAEVQDLLDMTRLRRGHALRRAEDVVEAQRHAMVLAIGPEGVDLGQAGVEQRQHMADTAEAVGGQFLDAADGERRDGERLHGGDPLVCVSPPPMACLRAAQPTGLEESPAEAL